MTTPPDRILDLRGLRCPQPVLRAKKALRDVAVGGALVLECTDPLTVIDVPHFGLINLIAQERIAAELIQDDFTKETLSAELFRLMDAETNRQMRQRLKEVVETLGAGGASERAAEEILNFLGKEK